MSVILSKSPTVWVYSRAPNFGKLPYGSLPKLKSLRGTLRDPDYTGVYTGWNPHLDSRQTSSVPCCAIRSRHRLGGGGLGGSLQDPLRLNSKYIKKTIARITSQKNFEIQLEATYEASGRGK